VQPATRSLPQLFPLIDALADLYGEPAPPPVTDPFGLVLWENVAYLVDDERSAAVFALLRAEVGLTPEAVLSTPLDALARIIEKGGMTPAHRAAKLQAAAEVALGLGLDELRALCRADPFKAARALRRFPGIGEPGANKILLFGHCKRTLAPDSNALRVLLRYGFGREEGDYGRKYRSAAEAVAPQLSADFTWLVRAHQLLRLHGQHVCKAGGPLCEICPLTGSCRWYGAQQS
jgi:endonuclease-3